MWHCGEESSTSNDPSRVCRWYAGSAGKHSIHNPEFATRFWVLRRPVVEVKAYAHTRRWLMSSSLSVGALLWCLLLAPSLLYAQAQASIAGIVRDTSGAVLPGVTVEASSPELIEKVRAAVTDTTGQYRIENLRPGAYTVTFALAGFSTV